MKTLPPIIRSRPAWAGPALCLAALAVALVIAKVNAQSGVLNVPTDPFAPPAPAPAMTPSAPPAATVPAPVTNVPAPAVVTPSATGNTIVNANQRVQPNKRGVCENHMSAEDFRVLAPGVSWFYNWAANTSDMPAFSDHMDYVPMAWGHGGDPGAVAGAMGNHPRAVLALNEPNLKGQAFITPEEAAAFYRQVKQTADGMKIPVVGPNMALGSATGDSIKAIDPITKQETVYTWFVPYVQAFQFYAKKSNTQTGSMAVHSYNGLGDLKGAVGKMYETTGKPVWVTEFAFWKAPTDADEIQYLRQAVEYLENSSQVAGYAWFMNRADKNPKISLLDKASGKLTPLGAEYVKMPSHSVHVFYRIPGLLDAGKYVSNENMTLRDTTDADGDFDMVSTGASWVAYNIQIDVAGTYLLRLRVSGAPGTMEVAQDGKVLGSAETNGQAWHTVETSVSLAAGTQTLRVNCNGQALHSIEFEKVSQSVAMK